MENCHGDGRRLLPDVSMKNYLKYPAAIIEESKVTIYIRSKFLQISFTQYKFHKKKKIYKRRLIK